MKKYIWVFVVVAVLILGFVTYKKTKPAAEVAKTE